MNASNYKNRNFFYTKIYVLILFTLICFPVNNAKSQTLDFPYFDSLPSEHGWIYKTNSPDTIFSIVDSTLVQKSANLGSDYGLFYIERGRLVIPTSNWSLKVRAKVTNIESGTSGFIFSVTQGDYLYSVRLTKTEIYVIDEISDQFKIISSDNSIFHDITLSGEASGKWSLVVDGSLKAEGLPINFSTLYWTPYYDLLFGDGTSESGVNADGEWASYTFTQFQPQPVITAIEDVPNDQGGWVKLLFTKSTFDSSQLTFSKISSPELYTIEMNDGTGWMAVANTLAYGKMIYSVLVPTTKDSTYMDNGLLYYRVIAGMDEGNYVSDVKMGYSIDNLAPSIPLGLIVTVTTEKHSHLSWLPIPDTDFRYYQIFRRRDGTSFEKINTTIDTSFTDNTVKSDSIYYYSIKAIDQSGNESAFSNSVNISITANSNNQNMPTQFYLSQNFPNPFNPQTTIEYGLASKDNVRLLIYNNMGRLVRELRNAAQNPGRYKVVWNGKNEMGESVSSGIYYYQLSTNKFTMIKKMIFVK